jgi:hypothetical protein
LLGDAGVNIGDMDVGRAVAEGSYAPVETGAGSAVMVIATGSPLPAELIAHLRAEPGILSVHPLSNE